MSIPISRHVLDLNMTRHRVAMALFIWSLVSRSARMARGPTIYSMFLHNGRNLAHRRMTSVVRLNNRSLTNDRKPFRTTTLRLRHLAESAAAVATGLAILCLLGIEPAQMQHTEQMGRETECRPDAADCMADEEEDVADMQGETKGGHSPR